MAQWVYENGKPAGKDTDTLPGANGVYLPFVGVEKTVGVVGLFPGGDTELTDPEQFHMLEMFVKQTAAAIEGAQLASAALDAKSRIENERFRNLLLTTFSTEMAEPLESISRLVSEFIKPENLHRDEIRSGLAEQLRQETKRLNNLIAELPEIIAAEKP